MLSAHPGPADYSQSPHKAVLILNHIESLGLWAERQQGGFLQPSNVTDEEKPRSRSCTTIPMHKGRNPTRNRAEFPRVPAIHWRAEAFRVQAGFILFVYALYKSLTIGVLHTFPEFWLLLNNFCPKIPRFSHGSHLI